MHTARHRVWARGLGLAVVFAAALSALLLLPSGSGAATAASSLYAQSNSTVASILYDQNSNMGILGFPSTSLRGTVALADDFVVPAGTSWQIGTIKTTGLDHLLTSAKVTIYSDSSNAPGTPVYTRTLSSGSFAEEPAPYPNWEGGKLIIPVEVSLASGHYWLSVQGDGAYDQPYFWESRDVVSNQAAMALDPKGFAGCSPSTSWSDLGTCAHNTAGSLDLMFALYGTGQMLPSPAVSTGSVEGIGPTTATLTGTVNPKGFDVTDCHFAYGPGSYDLPEDLPHRVACKVLPGSGTSDVTVSATLTGLSPMTAYTYALSASNATGSINSRLSYFITAAKPSQVMCVVPKVKGKTLAAARKAITKGHCSIGKITKINSSKQNKGHVVWQSPKPGKHLTNGAKVALKVGK